MIWQKAASPTCHPSQLRMDSSNLDPLFNVWFLSPAWVTLPPPNGIWIGSAVFAQYIRVSNTLYTQTDKHTNRRRPRYIRHLEQQAASYTLHAGDAAWKLNVVSNCESMFWYRHIFAFFWFLPCWSSGVWLWLHELNLISNINVSAYLDCRQCALCGSGAIPLIHSLHFPTFCSIF